MKRATVLLSLTAAAVCAVRTRVAAQAGWTMVTDYPRDSMSGTGIVTFSQELARASNNELTVTPAFDGSGINASQTLAAIGRGSLQAGDVFGGTAGATDPLFLLSSLPFLTKSIGDARRLYDAARISYDAAFTRLGLKLLYVTPWPPSGIWAKIPVRTVDDVARLHIRTYDATSTTVMNALGAHVQSLTFNEAMPLLKDGSIDAVLSSGDGGAGRKLWEYLPVYTKLEYAFPLSFATMNRPLYEALEPKLRNAVDAAAGQTQTAQWQTIETRLARNEATMRANGVTIVADVSPELRQKATAAGAAAVAAWKSQIGASGRAILERF